jgi:hypothetical protein
MSAPPAPRDDAERGSVLIEALVAIAVVALVLTWGYRAVGGSALRARAAEASRTAALIAQSRLATVGAEIPLAPGETRGRDGAFAWRVEVAPQAAQASTAGELYAVTVSVRDLGGVANRAVLRTLRVGPSA